LKNKYAVIFLKLQEMNESLVIVTNFVKNDDFDGLCAYISSGMFNNKLRKHALLDASASPVCRVRFVECMLSMRAPVDARNYEGYTALGLACNNHCAKCIAVILKHEPYGGLQKYHPNDQRVCCSTIWESFKDVYDATCVRMIVECDEFMNKHHFYTFWSDLVKLLTKNNDVDLLKMVASKYNYHSNDSGLYVDALDNNC